MLLIIESTVLTVFNNKKGVAFHKGDTDYPTACHKENVRKRKYGLSSIIS